MEGVEVGISLSWIVGSRLTSEGSSLSWIVGTRLAEGAALSSIVGPRLSEISSNNEGTGEGF